MISVTPLTYLPIKQGIVKSNDINDFKSWQSLLIYASLSLNLPSVDPPQGTKRDATADLTFSVVTNYHRRNHVRALLQLFCCCLACVILAKTHVTYRRETWREIKLEKSTVYCCTVKKIKSSKRQSEEVIMSLEVMCCDSWKIAVAAMVSLLNALWVTSTVTAVVLGGMAVVMKL